MISVSLIKKWKKMLSHKSVFHVNQMEGNFYSVGEIKGYYNDLRGKAIFTSKFDDNGIPYNIASLGEQKKKIYFPITIIQYGLGCYDVYLEKGEKDYKKKMLMMADWVVTHSDQNGAVDAFGPLMYRCSWSSMAQGEGASLLARAYVETSDPIYLETCRKLIHFMLCERDKGGTSEYTEEGLLLHEYPDKSLVLNGWIFSAFGLLDCYKITKEEIYRRHWKDAVRGIRNMLNRFDCGHWSFYDLGGKYTSPFYHCLHIELLKALNHLEPDPVFEKYIQKWTSNKQSRFWSWYAFGKKAIQKLTEKKNTEWVLVE